MFKHDWTMALRSLSAHRAFTLFSVAGLATGLTACLLITLFAYGELSYDRHHMAAERIQRIAHAITINGREIRVPLVPGRMAGHLEANVPGIEEIVRFVRRSVVGASGENRFVEEDVLFADPSFPRIFTLPPVAGQVEDALTRPDGAILTERTARKYFGGEPAVGRRLMLDGDGFTVAAVVEDISDRSHLAFDMVVPLSNLPAGPWIERWSANNLYTYVELAPGVEPEDLERALDRLVDEELGPAFAASVGKSLDQFRAGGGEFDYFLQPLRSIHLESDLRAELRPNGDGRVVQTLIGVGFLILLISCMNYVNLATARNTDRLREIGLRKALGAQRRELAVQFLFETGALVLLAALVALATTALLLWLTGWGGGLERLGDVLSQPEAAAWGLLGLVVVLLLAGAYPALVMASASPGISVRRGGAEGRLGRALRSTMVVFQFAAALVLVCWAFTVERQMEYVAEKDLGFEPEGVVLVDGARDLGDRWRAFRQEVRGVPGVAAASGTNSVPGRFVLEGYLYPEGSMREEDLVLTRLIEADAAFVETLGIRVTSGRGYERRHEATRSAILVNRPAAHRLQYDAPVGRRVTMAKIPSEIVGVIGELHFDSLRDAVQPVVIRPLGGVPKMIAVRLEGGERERALEEIEGIWSRFLPDQPFDPAFLEAEVAARYEGEQTLLETIQAFALTAILLACLGIYGLAAYTAVRRRRAIGIRRALGASTGQVVWTISWELMRWVALAVLLAMPVALWAARRWLSGFAYRADLPWWLIPTAAALVVALALATVVSRVLRTALARPAECL